MPFRPLRLVTRRGREPRAEAVPEWDEGADDPADDPADDAARAAPAVPATPMQLSLFVFEDTVPPRAPRLRRLKSLLTALESQRHGLDDLAALTGRQDPAVDPPGTPAPVPTPLWPDSFFD